LFLIKKILPHHTPYKAQYFSEWALLRVSTNTIVLSSKLYDSFSDPCITHFGIVGAQLESFVGVIRAAGSAKFSEYQRVSQD
jgi:hypothetical protein